MINFKNTIIIMTSNIGSEFLLQANNSETQAQVQNLLKMHFKPELLNRIDEIIMFNSLDDSVVFKIIDKFIAELNKRLQTQHLSIKLTDEAKTFLANEGFEKVYGARPLKRFIQKHIETNLAKEILKGNISSHQEIVVDYQNGDIIFQG
jgi:ATP-dependent Clp protease ATP-binding subunit ClpB